MRIEDWSIANKDLNRQFKAVNRIKSCRWNNACRWRAAILARCRWATTGALQQSLFRPADPVHEGKFPAEPQARGSR
jgi:hypothetical protein